MAEFDHGIKLIAETPGRQLARLAGLTITAWQPAESNVQSVKNLVISALGADTIRKDTSILAEDANVNAVELIRRLHQHRAWVNGNLLAATTPLTQEQLQTPFAIGQGSIWKSLVHLYAAEYVWLEALLGQDAAVLPGDAPGKIPGNQQGSGGLLDLNDLREKWTAQERRWTGYLETLTPEALDEPVLRFVSSLGRRLTTRRSDVLLHVCTHAHYTVAQVINMLRQVGINPLPDTMLITLARREGTGEPT